MNVSVLLTESHFISSNFFIHFGIGIMSVWLTIPVITYIFKFAQNFFPYSIIFDKYLTIHNDLRHYKNAYGKHFNVILFNFYVGLCIFSIYMYFCVFVH